MDMILYPHQKNSPNQTIAQTKSRYNTKRQFPSNRELSFSSLVLKENHYCKTILEIVRFV